MHAYCWTKYLDKYGVVLPEAERTALLRFENEHGVHWFEASGDFLTRLREMVRVDFDPLLATDCSAPATYFAVNSSDPQFPLRAKEGGTLTDYKFPFFPPIPKQSYTDKEAPFCWGWKDQWYASEGEAERAFNFHLANGGDFEVGGVVPIWDEEQEIESFDDCCFEVDGKVFDFSEEAIHYAYMHGKVGQVEKVTGHPTHQYQAFYEDEEGHHFLDAWHPNCGWTLEVREGWGESSPILAPYDGDYFIVGGKSYYSFETAFHETETSEEKAISWGVAKKSVGRSLDLTSWLDSYRSDGIRQREKMMNVLERGFYDMFAGAMSAFSWKVSSPNTGVKAFKTLDEANYYYGYLCRLGVAPVLSPSEFDPTYAFVWSEGMEGYVSGEGLLPPTNVWFISELTPEVRARLSRKGAVIPVLSASDKLDVSAQKIAELENRIEEFEDREAMMRIYLNGKERENVLDLVRSQKRSLIALRADIANLEMHLEEHGFHGPLHESISTLLETRPTEGGKALLGVLGALTMLGAMTPRRKVKAPLLAPKEAAGEEEETEEDREPRGARR